MFTGRFRTVAQSLGAVLIVAAVLAAAAGPAMAGPAATQGSASPSFVVGLAEDGSAEVTLALTYDLETDDERDAFRTLQNDSETRADVRERFQSRMASVASDASNATGRDMTVSDATIEITTADDGSVGVVELGVGWSNLAATEDGALVVTEPFASGFEPDRQFTLRGPDGYERASATPDPDVTEPNAAIWDAGSDLSGFRVTFEQASDGGGTDDGGGGDGDGNDGGGSAGAPGFGVVLGLVALAAAAVALARRR